jgi:hypothetical protein
LWKFLTLYERTGGFRVRGGREIFLTVKNEEGGKFWLVRKARILETACIQSIQLTFKNSAIAAILP